MNGITDNPRLEARLLLAHALGLTQNDLIRDPHRPIDPSGVRYAARPSNRPRAARPDRRASRVLEPGLSGLPRHSVPLPDSETLIEAALSAFAGRPPRRRILDLGTGTGCLVLALLQEFPYAFGIGLDLRPEAASLAKAQCGSKWPGRPVRILSSTIGLAPIVRPVRPDNLQPALYLQSGHLGPDARGRLARAKLALDGGEDGFDASARSSQPATSPRTMTVPLSLNSAGQASYGGRHRARGWLRCVTSPRFGPNFPRDGPDAAKSQKKSLAGSFDGFTVSGGRGAACRLPGS